MCNKKYRVFKNNILIFYETVINFITVFLVEKDFKWLLANKLL